jgi:hypothetical protein
MKTFKLPKKIAKAYGTWAVKNMTSYIVSGLNMAEVLMIRAIWVAGLASNGTKVTLDVWIAKNFKKSLVEGKVFGAVALSAWENASNYSRIKYANS